MVEHSSDVVLLVERGRRDQLREPRARQPRSDTGRATGPVGRSSIWSRATIVTRPRPNCARLRRSRTVSMVKFEASLVRVDGQRRRMEATIANLLGGDAVDGLVATFRDVTEQRNLERQLSHRAFHDELTGLANRALFLDRMDHALRVARPDDRSGRRAVRRPRRLQVGERCARTRRRRPDAAIDRRPDPPGRPDRATPRRASVATSSRSSSRTAVASTGRSTSPSGCSTASASRSRSPATTSPCSRASAWPSRRPGMTTAGLLRDADIAMYEAKRAGKSQIKIFDPAMRLTATRHLEFRSDLGSAIERDQLRLVFQPMVDLRTQRVVGAEALLRWDHPDAGGRSPRRSSFPIAERAGLIVPIGNWVVDQSIAGGVPLAARAARSSVSVNVSALQIRSAGIRRAGSRVARGAPTRSAVGDARDHRDDVRRGDRVGVGQPCRTARTWCTHCTR